MEHFFRVVPPHEWPNKHAFSACERPGCGRRFGLLARPANCHACGAVMCAPCLSRRLTLPGRPGSAPVPLCPACAVGVAEVQAAVEGVCGRHERLRAGAERLLGVSSLLRGENERLMKVAEELAARVEQLRTANNTVAADPPTTGASLVESPSPAGESVSTDAGSSSAGENNNNSDVRSTVATRDDVRNAELTALEDELKKRQRALDIREAALQEAARKVSSDALRVARQRAELQEEKDNLHARVAQEFKAVVEAECVRLQDVHLEELAGLGEQFAEWRRKATDTLEARRCEQTAILTWQEETHRERLAQQEEALERAHVLHKEETAREQRRFDEKLFLMQGLLDAARREFEAERKQRWVAQCTADILTLTLQEERQRQAMNCLELHERLDATQLFGNSIYSLVCGTVGILQKQKQQQQQSSSSSLSLSVVSGNVIRLEDVEKCRCELGGDHRLSREFGDGASEDAPDVAETKQLLAQQTTELQQLRERLSRTGMALVKANRIETQLRRQMRQEQEQKDHSSMAALVWATQVVEHAHLYGDEFICLLGGVLLELCSVSTQTLQEEWSRRRALTWRHTVALEEATASIKDFRDELKRREARVVRAADTLRVREREMRARLSRLFKVSVALRTVAGRLRGAPTGETTDRTA